MCFHFRFWDSQSSIELTMDKDGSALAGDEGVGHVGHHIVVGIANGVDAWNVGLVTLGVVGNVTTLFELNTDITANPRRLLILVAGEESTALHGLVVTFEVNAEQVQLRVRRQAGVSVGVRAVAETVEGGDGVVDDLDLVDLEVLLPLRELLLGLFAVLGRVGSVDEGDNVLVEGAHLADEDGNLLQSGEETQALVGVLVAVTPGAPVDALAPVLLDAWGVGEQVAQTGSQNDLAGGDGLCALGVDGEPGVVVVGLDGRDGAVGEAHRVVVREELTSSVAVVGGSDTCTWSY